MVGVGPVDRELMEKHRADKIPFGKSKILAVKDILAKQLYYDEEELEELMIAETRLVTK